MLALVNVPFATILPPPPPAARRGVRLALGGFFVLVDADHATRREIGYNGGSSRIRPCFGNREKVIVASYAADSTVSSALVGAVDWLHSVMLGQAGMFIAVIAVATIGLMMLAGRVRVGRAATIILGCFILFGAGTIADGLLAGAEGRDTAIDLPPPPPPQANYKPMAPKAQVYDPYAGASVPIQPPAQSVFPH